MLLAALLLERFTLPNPRPFAGFSDTCGEVPVPVRSSVGGELAARWVGVVEQDRAPPACGKKVTAIVHLPPATILLAHIFVWLKSPAFAPVTAILLDRNSAVQG